ncbi:MAG TPA: hypothetical protein VK427_04860, partial [Kofleriaceae bacterium]|nr:hypothetical protein [Kofleriaceae bacterium]
VYLFGGLDTAGNPTGTAWLFDSNFAPAGAYLELGDFPGFARANEVAIATSADRFVVTGAPPVDLAGTGVSARSDVPALASAGATFVTATGVRTALALDATGRLVRYHEGAFELLAPSRPGAALAALRDGKLLAVGGGTAEEANDILVVDAFGGVTTIADALTTERTNARVAVTRRHVVVVGGGPTEILDAATLARVVEPRERIDGKPFPLPNDQVLIVDDATGALVLFTPPGV